MSYGHVHTNQWLIKTNKRTNHKQYISNNKLSYILHIIYAYYVHYAEGCQTVVNIFEEKILNIIFIATATYSDDVCSIVVPHIFQKIL